MDGALDVLLEGNDDLLLPRERGVNILLHAPVVLIAVEGVVDVRAAEEMFVLVAREAALLLDFCKLLHDGMAYAFLLHAFHVVGGGGNHGVGTGKEGVALVMDRSDVRGAPGEDRIAAFGEGGRGGDLQTGNSGSFLLYEDVLYGEFPHEVENIFPAGREGWHLLDDFEGEVLAVPHVIAHLRERHLREA